MVRTEVIHFLKALVKHVLDVIESIQNIHFILQQSLREVTSKIRNILKTKWLAHKRTTKEQKYLLIMTNRTPHRPLWPYRFVPLSHYFQRTTVYHSFFTFANLTLRTCYLWACALLCSLINVGRRGVWLVGYFKYIPTLLYMNVLHARIGSRLCILKRIYYAFNRRFIVNQSRKDILAHIFSVLLYSILWILFPFYLQILSVSTFGCRQWVIFLTFSAIPPPLTHH